MSKFEDQLLDDLMRAHGPALAAAQRPDSDRRKPRSTKPVWIAAGAVALAGATTGVLMITSSGQPAYAVTENQDGSVTVSIKNTTAIDAVNTELRRIEGPDKIAVDKADCVSIERQIPLNKEGVALTTLDRTIKEGYFMITAGPPGPDGEAQLKVLKCEAKPETSKPTK